MIFARCHVYFCELFLRSRILSTLDLFGNGIISIIKNDIVITIFRRQKKYGGHEDSLDCVSDTPFLAGYGGHGITTISEIGESEKLSSRRL